MGNFSDVPEKDKMWDPQIVLETEKFLNSSTNPRIV
jgi:hypothetical protein